MTTRTVRLKGGRCIHRSESDGWSIFFAEDLETHEEIKVVGTIDPHPSGREMTVYGEDVDDGKYGPQLNAHLIEPDLDPDSRGITEFIQGLGIEGIGPELAGRIAERFGTRSRDIVERTPDRLSEVPGVGPGLVAEVRKTARGSFKLDLLEMMTRHGLPGRYLPALLETFGPAAVTRIREDPYRAAEAPGVSFSAADLFALKMGVSKSDGRRYRAAVAQAISDATREGKCGEERKVVESVAQDLLKESGPFIGNRTSEIRQAVDDMRKAGQLMALPGPAGPTLHLRKTVMTERAIASFLTRAARDRPPWPEIKIDKALEWIERKEGIELADGQRDGIRKLCENRVSVMTGGPGVGKTTTLKSALRILAAKGVGMRLMAPTGIAAKRMSEATGRYASTIHSGLKDKKGNAHGPDNPFPEGLVVLDETSMMDIDIAKRVIDAIGPNTALLMCGDVDQLPTIGPGRVLADAIEVLERIVPDAADNPRVARLNKVFRQAEGSPIVDAAHAINAGFMPPRPEGDSDFRLLPRKSAEKIRDTVLDQVLNRLPARGFDPVRDVQVLAPVHDGEAGVTRLNELLRDHLNPAADDKPQIVVASKDSGQTRDFRLGDKVLQTRNDKKLGIVNGDIGFVVGVDQRNSSMIVDFSGNRVPVDRRMAMDLVHAYAMTIHKSQGTEAPAVVIPIADRGGSFLQRNLLYTAVTRGKSRVMMIGSERAVADAVKRNDNVDRNTTIPILAEKLCAPRDPEPDTEAEPA